MLTDIRILDIEPKFSSIKLRVPLKFGSEYVEETTLFAVKVNVENKREDKAAGLGNVLLSDSWAFPGQELSHSSKDKILRALSLKLVDLFNDYRECTHPLDIYFDLKPQFKRINLELKEEMNVLVNIPDLATLMCASPIDAGIHDGFGKVNGVSSYQGYGFDFMKYDLSKYLGEEYKGKYISNYIKEEYDRILPVFHLVGGVDKLRKEEVAEEDPQDGLPVSLDEWIRRDGLYCFKIKLRGDDLDWDINRTAEVAKVIEENKKGKYHLTVDTNERCETPEYMVDYLETLRKKHPQIFNSILYIEQPTERDLHKHYFDMHKLSKLKPVLVDESVSDLENLELAKKLGWSGIALKTCKGQSSSLVYTCYAQDEGMIYSVQDLTNPGFSFIQSAGFAARISPIMGMEYNSRQFIPWVNDDFSKVHSSLFWVKSGNICTESIGKLGLGYRENEINRRNSNE